MKKEITSTILALVLGALILIAFATLPSPQNRSVMTGNVIFTPTMPADCSVASIRAVWDSTFKFPGVLLPWKRWPDKVIVGEETDTTCKEFFAYKIDSTEPSQMWIMRGWDDPTKSPRKQMIFIKGKFNQAYIDQIKVLQNFPVNNYIELDLSYPNVFDKTNGRPAREILNGLDLQDITTARKSFNDRYKIHKPFGTMLPTLRFYKTRPLQLISDKEWVFGFTNIEDEKQSQGKVSGVKYLNYYSYTEDQCIATASEEPLQTDCQEDDTRTLYYTFENPSCAEAIRDLYPNVTEYCDYDSDGIIGEITDIDSLDLTLTMDIASDPKIIIKSGTKSIVEFTKDVSNPVNFRNVYIEKQLSTDIAGYTFVKGLKTSKTIIVDKIATSKKLCIKDAEITDLSTVSDDCSASDETIITCPTTSGSYPCTIVGNTFVVSGLTNSAVLQFPDSNDTGGCDEDWVCTAWSNIASECGTRDCTCDCSDSTDCSGSNLETKSCTTAGCQYDSDCSSTKECIAGTCVTINDEECDFDSDCEDDEECLAGECVDKTGSAIEDNLLTIIIIIVVLIILAVFGIILHQYGKKPQSTLPPKSPPPKSSFNSQQRNY